MASEVFNELLPLVPVLGRRDVLLVPEGVESARIRGKLFGHEAELDEGADVVLEQAVVNLIDVGKVVNGLTVFVLVVEAGLVVEDGVKADVFEAGDAAGFAKVVAVAFTKRDDAAFGAEHFLPKVGEGV